MVESVRHKSTRSDPILTPECRIIYPYLHERRTKNGKGQLLVRKLPDGSSVPAPKHDAGVLVPKLNNDPALCANYQMLSRLCMEACTKQPGWGGFPAGGYWPISDGDAPPKAKAPTPGQAPVDPAVLAAKYAYKRGHWVIEIGSQSEIGPRICVMQGGQAVEIPARVIAGRTMYKSGDYGHVSLMCYTFHNETWGCKFGFEGVLFTREGEAIGGTGGPRAAEAMFGGIAHVAASAPAAAYTAPGPQYAPPPASAPAAPQVPGFAPPPAAAAPGFAPVPAAPPAPAPQMAVPGAAPMPALPPMPR